MEAHSFPATRTHGASLIPFTVPGLEFHAGHPTVGAEATALASLAHHREYVDHFVALEIAYGAFRTRRVEYMAVVRNDAVIGLCSRGQIGFVMGSRFGFALYSHSAVETAMVPDPLIVRSDAPVRDVLDRALARRGDGFHEDIVLVDAEEKLIGLIQAEALAQLQSRLVAEQLDALRRQHETLRQQNLDLFRASHAVRQSQGLYLGLFEGHTLGVALLDPEGGIHEHNRRLVELLGLSDPPATLVSLVAWVDERERPAFLALLDAQAHGAVATTREFTLHVPERGPRTFRCSTGWIKETGQICACLDDITDQRLLERKLLRQEKQTLLDTLVGGIAHELNNKLTPVQGFAELLTMDPANPAHHYAQYIKKGVEESAHIIRQLLQLSKPNVATLQPVDLRTIVEETLAMLRFQVRSADCEVSTLLPATPVWALADAGQMKQIVINLVLNALQAMEGREPALLAVEVNASEETVALIVADNGCGIPPENADRIFDPFFTTKGPERGSGLGLSICYSIVRQHGGEITFASQPETGTRFTLTLPREKTVPGLRDVSVAVRHEAPPSLPRGERVLVVEDDAVVRLFLQEMLRTQFSCHVDLAADGIEALAALQRSDYALILSDVQMPRMNGPQLFNQLRETHPDLADRFIFLTGYPGRRQFEAEIAQWKVPVLAKPFSLPQLAALCGPYFRSASASRRAG